MLAVGAAGGGGVERLPPLPPHPVANVKSARFTAAARQRSLDAMG